MINTPGNPSGKIFTRQELEWIAAFAHKHDLFVFTDEIYEYFVYDGKHISPATLPGMRERTITISGYSKTFSITGWRVGLYHLRSQMDAGHRLFPRSYLCLCTGAASDRRGGRYLQAAGKLLPAKFPTEYVQKRDQLCDVLKEIGLTPSVPNGAYYVLADARILPGKTSKEKSMALLRETGVATVAGSAFYHGGGGQDLIRFCFAKTEAELNEACRRLKTLPEKLGVKATAGQVR